MRDLLLLLSALGTPRTGCSELFPLAALPQRVGRRARGHENEHSEVVDLVLPHFYK